MNSNKGDAIDVIEVTNLFLIDLRPAPQEETHADTENLAKNLWLRSSQPKSDGGRLTVYVLLSLVNKEAASAFDRTPA